MAKMYWKSRFRNSTPIHGRPLEFKKEIHNWRLLSCGYISTQPYGLIEGLFLLTDLCWFLPGMKVENLMKHIERGKDHEFEHYHFTADNYWPLFCHKCKGSGKLDWLSKITGVGAPGIVCSTVDKFERDPSHVLQHVDLSGNLKNHQWLGVTLIQEGEELCQECLGTGITLDGRYRIFSAKQFKKRLIKVEMSEAIKHIRG